PRDATASTQTGLTTSICLFGGIRGAATRMVSSAWGLSPVGRWFSFRALLRGSPSGPRGRLRHPSPCWNCPCRQVLARVPNERRVCSGDWFMVSHFVIRVTSGAGRSDHPMNAWKPAAMFDETAKAVQSLRVSDQMELRKDVQRYGVMPSALGEEWLR